jgi:hypothetical protein
MRREPDDTLAVYPPGNDSGITLRLSLHTKLFDPRMDDDIAEQFCRADAERRGLPLCCLGDRVYFTETGAADWPDRIVQMQYWQLAVGQIFVVTSATIWGPDQQAPTIQSGLTSVLPILKSIRCT